MVMHRIRNLNPGWDSERVFELFEKLQLRPEQVNSRDVPKTGFYDYQLSPEALFRRLEAGRDLSLVLEDNQGRILAYLLAYNLRKIDSAGLLAEQGHEDFVLSKLRYANPRAVYIDQFAIAPGLPVFIAGRLLDVWINMMYGEKVDGAVCAIPESPWQNQSSRRIALVQGFERCGKVDEISLTLGLWAKPFWKRGECFNPREDFLN